MWVKAGLLKGMFNLTVSQLSVYLIYSGCNALWIDSWPQGAHSQEDRWGHQCIWLIRNPAFSTVPKPQK